MRLDLTGVASSALGLMLLLYPLIQGQELGWPPRTYASMAGGVVVLAALARQQRTKEGRRWFYDTLRQAVRMPGFG